jgi:hypothetical protein
MSSKMSANTKIFIPKIFDLNVDRIFFPEWQVFLEKKSFLNKQNLKLLLLGANTMEEW